MISMLYKIKSKLSLYSLYYAETCIEFAGPIPASLRLGTTQILSKKRHSGGEPLATLCLIRLALRFEPRALRSRDERINPRLTGRLWCFHILYFVYFVFDVNNLHLKQKDLTKA